MRQAILIATLSSVVASVVTTAVIGGSFFGAGTASSANAPIEAETAISPGGVESIIQGDVDCGGNVTPVDSLKTLRHDAGLTVQQDEPCPDIGTVIPTGEGVPGPQGPQGDEGPAGPQGPAGISGYEILQEFFERDTVGSTSGSRPCPEGKVALGGGLTVALGPSAAEALGYQLTDGPLEDGTGWKFKIRSFDTELRTYALRFACANVAE